MDRLTITRPDDWHLHLRDAEVLAAVLPHTTAQFARAIVMPNLARPIVTTDDALAYHERILNALPVGASFSPLMTLYLTDATAPEEILRARNSGCVYGVKLYPAGATTHSEAGVTNLAKTEATLETMAEIGMPLLIHGEVTDSAVDIFDREHRFIETVLAPLAERFPRLKIVLEHVTTIDGVEFVRSARDGVAATITPHHLLLNRNALLAGGIQPHHYCLPILKDEGHRQRLVEAATSGNSRFFLGTDSAPHPRHDKESACGCAGIYSAHAAMPLYAEVFEDAGALDKLEAFASFYGPDFYGLPRNHDSLTLIRATWTVPSEYALGEDTLVPLRAGTSLRWQVQV